MRIAERPQTFRSFIASVISKRKNPFRIALKESLLCLVNLTLQNWCRFLPHSMSTKKSITLIQKSSPQFPVSAQWAWLFEIKISLRARFSITRIRENSLKIHQEWVISNQESLWDKEVRVLLLKEPLNSKIKQRSFQILPKSDKSLGTVLSNNYKQPKVCQIFWYSLD